MNIEKLQSGLFAVDESSFDEFAISLFKYQSKHNTIYKKYLSLIGCKIDNILKTEEIPFLPIDFFKNHRVVSGEWQEQCVFKSSGTTNSVLSQHFVRELSIYHDSLLMAFGHNYGEPANYHIMALLPSYIENTESSLIAMTKYLIESSKSPFSGFYLDDLDALVKQIVAIKDRDRKIILLGVSFALLELSENFEVDFKNVIVMETGGMKGRRKELTRQELHDALMKKLNLRSVHSEYGMTELLSQAYAQKEGNFRPPPWMKVLIREINDPFAVVTNGKVGGINVIDLANLHSCAFIETQDIGLINEDSSFKVLGRLDNSEIRGCNLLVA